MEWVTRSKQKESNSLEFDKVIRSQRGQLTVRQNPGREKVHPEETENWVLNGSILIC